MRVPTSEPHQKVPAQKVRQVRPLLTMLGKLLVFGCLLSQQQLTGIGLKLCSVSTFVYLGR